MSIDLYLLTDDRFVAPEQPDWYARQVLTEDGLVMSALERKGLKVKKVSWSDPLVNWSDAQAAIFRSTWDYFDRFEEFKVWFEETSEKLEFINPYNILRWNMDKHYLQDLEKKGIPIVPSLFIEKGDQKSLTHHVLKSQWKDLILKPCVSGCARHTYRFKADDSQPLEDLFNSLIQGESMMLQEFHPSIMERGEVSHMVMGGRYTHSILKQAKKGDFRVQDDFGGSVTSYSASEEERHFAEEIFKACSPSPLYGRADIMWDSDGKAMVSELELMEPELWFRMHPEAADMLAEAVYARLNA
jgi:glutathione synthase/RimK-type ligase-like ATP-grasp enzyme